jgi:putative membrane protein
MMYARGIGVLAGASGYGANTLGCGWFGMPMMGFGLVLIVLGVIAVVHYMEKSNQNSSTGVEMELLNERFVKGELTEEEYTKMKRVLKSK